MSIHTDLYYWDLQWWRSACHLLTCFDRYGQWVPLEIKVKCIFKILLGFFSLCTKPHIMTFCDHFLDYVKQSPWQNIWYKNRFLGDAETKGRVGAWIPSHKTPSIPEWSWYAPHLPLRVPFSDATSYLIKSELSAPLTAQKQRQSPKGSKHMPTQGKTSVCTHPRFWQNVYPKLEESARLLCLSVASLLLSLFLVRSLSSTLLSR